MTFDASLTITSIIAIIALISPIITTTLNNKHQMNLKKLDLEYNRIIEREKLIKDTLENYCESLSEVLVYSNPSYEVLIKYGASCGKAILYFEDNEAETALKIFSAIQSRNFTGTQKIANHHLLKIKEQLNKNQKL